MTRLCVFLLLAFALFASTATLVACGESDSRVEFADEPDADAPEVPLPPIRDARVEDADTGAPPRPEYDASDEAVVCTSTPCATQLAAGQDHFCALLSDSTVRCWGDNTKGALGTGDIDGGAAAGFAPIPVVGVSNATQISAAEFATCACNAEGGVQCWGGNAQGQLGLQASPPLTDRARHPTPADVVLPGPVTRVDVGPRSVCALTANHQAYCWGANAKGQLARPVVTTGGPDLADLHDYAITRIGAGLESVFGLTEDGQLVNWGTVSGRETSLAASSVPFPLPTLSHVTNFAASPAHACAIAGGNVYCWGANNATGALGTGIPAPEPLPVLAEILTEGTSFPQQLALGGVGTRAANSLATASCVRMTDGTIQCCGDDQLGQLGRGRPGTLTPLFGRATAFEEYAVQVAVSTYATCALVQGGKVVCWGGNANGELGQGTRDTDPHPNPVPVAFQ